MLTIEISYLRHVAVDLGDQVGVGRGKGHTLIVAEGVVVVAAILARRDSLDVSMVDRWGVDVDGLWGDDDIAVVDNVAVVDLLDVSWGLGTGGNVDLGLGSSAIDESVGGSGGVIVDNNLLGFHDDNPFLGGES